MGGLGILIFNGLEDDQFDGEALERVSADGNLIAFAIPGMCAS